MSKSESVVVHAWYTKATWLYLLWPISLIYRLLSKCRRFAFTHNVFKTHRVGAPVIVVGNITVGGTGKTPLVIALVNYLKQQGFQPGIVSRGYGGTGYHGTDPYPYLVTADSSVTESGDEPLLMATQTQVPVVIDPVRPNAAEQLVQTYGCDVIVADDGLQHYALGRDIEIIVIDGIRLLGNSLCLPAGPLRESKQRLNTVDFVISNGGSVTVETDTQQYRMLLQGDALVSMNTDSPQSIPSYDTSQVVHAVAGIGNPDRFFNTLRQLGFKLIEHRFADHHNYVAADLAFTDDLPIIMTEKDAVKVGRIGPPNNSWYLPVNAHIDDAFYSQIVAKLPSVND